jgi:hypothetical protein
MSEASAWIQLQEKRQKPFFYYRRIDVYPQLLWNQNALKELDFNLDIGQLTVAIAPYGGPIAFTKDVVKSDIYKTRSDYLQIVRIYTSSGSFLGSFQWFKEEKPIFQLGWTKNLELVVLSLDGRVRVYDVHGAEIVDGPWRTKERVKKNSKVMGFSFREISGSAQDDIIVNAKIWNDGLAAFTKNGMLWVATDIFKKEQPWVKYVTDGIKTIHCLEVIPHDTQPQVLLAPDEEDTGKQDDDDDDDVPRNDGLKKMKRTVIVCTEKKAIDLKLRQGPFRCISLSPSGDYVALYNEEGEVSVVPNDFRAYYLKYKTKIRVRNKFKGTDCQIVPKQLLWCGDLAVLVYYERPYGDDCKSLLLMIGCFGNTYSFDYETPITLCQEIDCARIFSNTSCEILEQVNEHAVDIFRIGSVEPSALLFDAYIDYKQKKPSSIKTVMAIRKKSLVTPENTENNLEKASMECLRAACHEFITAFEEKTKNLESKTNSLQQTLLKASSYGRSFSNYASDIWNDTNEYSTICRHLRVLNAVRDKSCGLPITYKQFMRLTPKALVGRLSVLHKHYLAYNICNFLGVDKSEVLIDWGCTKSKLKKISSNEDSEETKKLEEEWIKMTTEQIHDKLKDVSLAQIALTAYESKNPRLAKSLLRLGREDEENMVETEKEYFDFNLAPDQVPLFLKMEEIDQSLEKAVLGLDSDYVYLVILYILQKGDKKFLYEKLQNSDYIRKLFVAYCREQDHKTLIEFYQNVLKFRSIGYHKIREAIKHLPDENLFVQGLRDAVKDLSRTKKNPIDFELTEEQIKLIDFQKRLLARIDAHVIPEADKDLDRQRVEGASVNETFYFCLLKQKNDKEIRKLGKEMLGSFDLSDKVYWHLKIKALAELGSWDEMERFVAKEPVSPIGYIPIIDLCLQHKNETQAIKYIPLIKDVPTRVDYYIGLKAPMFKEAIQSALEIQDLDLLEYLNTRTTNPKTKDTIQEVIDALKKSL